MTPEPGQDTGGRGHIFVSYSRRDLEWVRQLVTDLEAAGLPVWLDVHKLKPGAVWDNEIELALRGTDVLLVVLSENSATSHNVLDEINFGLSRNRLIVPVLYRACEIPYRLARLQNIDFTGPRELALRSLIERLHVATAQTGLAPFAAATVATLQPAGHAEVATRVPAIPTQAASTRSASAPVWRKPAVAGAVVGVSALLLAGFFLLRGRNDPGVSQPVASPATAAIQAPTSGATAAAAPTAVGQPPRDGAAGPLASQQPAAPSDNGGARGASPGPPVSASRSSERPGGSAVKPSASSARPSEPSRTALAEEPASRPVAGAAVPPASEPSQKASPVSAAPAASNAGEIRTPQPAPPVRPVSAVRDEEALIRKVIALYERALNEKSVSLLAEARPGLARSEAQAIVKGMEGGHTMSFGEIAVKVGETQATARLTRRDVVPGSPNLQIGLTMTFLKQGDGWVIERIERTQ